MAGIFTWSFWKPLSELYIHGMNSVFSKATNFCSYSQGFFARYIVNLAIGKMFLTHMLLENVTTKWQKWLQGD